MTSTANMEINRRGINMLYPPVGQLAVAAAEAAAAAAAAALVVSWAAAAAAAALAAAAAVASSTLNDAEVEACLVRKVSTWPFPTPKGGGVVIVKYPLVFEP